MLQDTKPEPLLVAIFSGERLDRFIELPDPRLAFAEFFNEAFGDILTARIPDARLMRSKEVARYLKANGASRKRKGGGR